MNGRQTRSLSMTQGNPATLIVHFALPMMIGNAFQLLYSIVDSAVVGRLIGVSAFAAVSATGFAYWLLLSIILGLTQGFGTLLAQRFGTGDPQHFRRTAGTAAVLCCIAGALLSVFGTLCARPALVMMGTPADILSDATHYLRIMAGGLFITTINNHLMTLLRSLGDSRTPVVAMVLSTLINVALDIALVLFTGLGVRAVALATLVAQAFAALYAAGALRSSEMGRLRKADMRLHKNEAAGLLRLGIPGALRNGVASLGGLVIQRVVNSYGTMFVAGVALPNRLFGLMEIVGAALDGAVAVYVAQNHGANNIERIKAGMHTARRLMLIAAVGICAVLLVIGRPLMALMIGSEGNAAILDIAQRQLWVMLAGLPSLYLLYLYRSAVQGMGNASAAMASGFVELFVRLLFVLAFRQLLGVWSAYLAEVAGWPVAMALMFVTYRRMMKNARNNQAINVNNC